MGINALFELPQTGVHLTLGTTYPPGLPDPARDYSAYHMVIQRPTATWTWHDFVLLVFEMDNNGEIM